MKQTIKNNLIQKVHKVDKWSSNRFNHLTTKQKSRQHGITMIEVTAGLVIIALLAVFLVPRVGALLGKSKVETAVQEITALITASQQYRSIEGDFELITLKVLYDGGYHIEPFSDSYMRNTYGQDIVIAAGTNDDFYTLTYQTVNQDGDCDQVLRRMIQMVDVTDGGATTTPPPSSGGIATTSSTSCTGALSDTMALQVGQ